MKMNNTSSEAPTFRINISDNNSNTAYMGDSDRWLLVSFGICIPILVAIGLIGNILTVFVLWNKEIKSTSIYFLRALVISDIAVLLTGLIGLSLLPIAQHVPYMRIFIDVIYPCIFTPIYYILMTLQMINVWITVAVTFERFIAVRFPLRSLLLRSKGNALVTIAVICFASIVFNLPRYFATKSVACPGVKDCFFVTPTEFGRASFYLEVFQYWLYLIFIYLLPVILLVVLNTLVIGELSKAHIKRKLLAANEVENNENNVTVSLVLIVAVFIMCQTPGLLAQFDFLDATVLLKFTCVSNTLFILNSAVNFVIYIASGKRFRAVYIQTITFRRH